MSGSPRAGEDGPPEGGSAEGRTPEGRSPEGRTLRGRSPEGRSAKGRRAEGKRPEAKRPAGKPPRARPPVARRPTRASAVRDDIASAAQLACLLEASAPKPGNVSPGRHFHDARYEDFLASAGTLAPGLLLLDLHLDGRSGLDLLESGSIAPARFGVVMLTGAGDIQTAVRAIKAGAMDFIEKSGKASEVLGRLGLDISPRSRLGDHPIAVQQLVAIGRAVDIEARVLVLDEPTASLDSEEVAKLFEVVRSLRSQGVAILFVSHFLEQVFAISDRMTVLRNGRIVGEHLTRDVTRLELVEEMLGRELEVLERLHREPSRQPDERRTPVLRATGLGRKGALAPTDLEVYDGEVIGVAGLLGSGRTELARLLFGADASDRGSVEVRGRRVALRSPRTAVDHKIGFSSENRRSEGGIGDLTVTENMMLGLQAARGWLRPVPPRTRDELVMQHVPLVKTLAQRLASLP